MHVVHAMLIATGSNYEVALDGVVDDECTQGGIQAVEPEIAVVRVVVETVATVRVLAAQGREIQVVVGQQFDGRFALFVGIAHVISK